MKRLWIFLLSSALLAAVCVAARKAAPERSGEIVIDAERREIRFGAVLQADAMTRPFGVEGHHAIVSRHGRASLWSLFKADPDDLAVRRALERLGAQAGENLAAETWTKREDPSDVRPSLRVEGSEVEVLVSWGRRAPVALATLLADRRSVPTRLDFRYGGNERHRSEFRSGCIVCLYSCPGGAIGNRNETIRDWVEEGAVFASKKSVLPRNGSRVTITLRLKEKK